MLTPGFSLILFNCMEGFIVNLMCSRKAGNTLWWNCVPPLGKLSSTRRFLIWSSALCCVWQFIEMPCSRVSVTLFTTAIHTLLAQNQNCCSFTVEFLWIGTSGSHIILPPTPHDLLMCYSNMLISFHNNSVPHISTRVWRMFKTIVAVCVIVHSSTRFIHPLQIYFLMSI